MRKQDLIEYLDVLYDTTKALYAYECPKIQEKLESLGKDINEKEFLNDIKYLYDKDICLIYGLEPSNINPKYTNKNIDDLKREKTDLNKIRENANKQFAQAKIINNLYINKNGIQKKYNTNI